MNGENLTQMSTGNSKAAALIQKNKDNLIQRWEERIRLQLSSSSKHNKTILRNKLSQVIDELVHTLSPDVIKLKISESARMEEEPDSPILNLKGFTIERVFLEFKILREVVFDLLCKELEIELQELEVILNWHHYFLRDICCQFVWNKSLQVAQDLRFAEKRADPLYTTASNPDSTVTQSTTYVLVYSLEGKVIRSNRTLNQNVGLTENQIEEFLKHHNILSDSQLDEQGILTFVAKAFTGEVTHIPSFTYNFFRNQAKSNQRRFEAHLYPLKDAHGRVREVVLVAKDVTHFQISGEQIQKMSDLLPVCLCYLNTEHCFQYANTKYLSLVDLTTLDELKQKHVRQIIGEANYLNRLPYLNRAFNGQEVQFESLFVAKNGRQHVLNHHYVPDFDKNGKVRGCVCIVTEVTESLTFQQSHQEGSDRLQRMFDQHSDAILIANIKGDYIDVNASACRMLGYTKEEFLRKRITDLISIEDLDRFANSQTIALEGKSEVSQWMIRRKDGTFIPIESNSKLLSDGTWCSIVRDLRTRTKALEPVDTKNS